MSDCSGTSWPELVELQKFVEMFDLDIPQHKLTEFANKLTNYRVRAEQREQEAKADLFKWITAADALAEHVDTDVMLTSENELVRKMGKQDWELSEKIRWSRGSLIPGQDVKVQWEDDDQT